VTRAKVMSRYDQEYVPKASCMRAVTHPFTTKHQLVLQWSIVATYGHPCQICGKMCGRVLHEAFCQYVAVANKREGERENTYNGW
jgi:hypothetical protein